MSTTSLESSDLASLRLFAKGKVRDIYSIGDTSLLLVASDRISAFDFLLKNTVKDKGRILTLMTHFWLTKVLPTHLHGLQHHFLSLTPPSTLTEEEQQLLLGRSMVVKKYKMFPLEVIVRGYITGTAWKEYQKSGTVHGVPQPTGLQRCQQFPGGPIYTPAIKAKYGGRDENISPSRAADLIGNAYAQRIQHLALTVYDIAYKWAFERGIIIADTKFEFGLDEEADEIVLADEVLTPDCSRFWSVAEYVVGQNQMSFDKQFLCDWMESNGLDGTEGVVAPDEVIARTSDNYHEIFRRLTNTRLEDAIREFSYNTPRL